MGEIIYPRGRQPEKDISSFNTEGQEGTRVIRKFRPQGEVDMNQWVLAGCTGPASAKSARQWILGSNHVDEKNMNTSVYLSGQAEKVMWFVVPICKAHDAKCDEII